MGLFATEKAVQWAAFFMRDTPRWLSFGAFGQAENNGETLGERLWRRQPCAAALGSHDGIQRGVVEIGVSRTFYELV